MANNNDKKVLNVPDLRFPEFSGEWVETELQDIVPNICSGKDRISNSGEVALYGSTGVIGRTNSASYKENIVLVARVGANAGQMQIGNAPCGVTDNTLVIDAKEWNYYIYYFLQHYNLNRLVFGSGQPLITGGMLKRIKVRYGCKAERNNITRLLCLIDERIATQNKIIEKLQSLIKGIRNNMMIQNQGDYIALQDIADIYQPKTILSTDLTEDGYLVYGANGIIGKYHLYNHEKEQICITCRGNTCGTVNYTEPKSWITGNAMVINTDNFAENVNKRYLFHYLSSINFNSIISGSGQPQIVRQPLAKLKIILPELTIQEHIAKCLDTILAKIKNEQTSLQAIQIQKSYLLSQMFI
jgi:type I restriction enzyme S subunit